MDYIELTRAFSWFCWVLAFGFLFNMSHYEGMARKMVTGPSGFIMGGILPSLVGAIIIHYPHISVHSFSALKICGWVLFLIGVIRMLFVRQWIGLMEQNIKIVPILFAVFGLIFGCLLTYSGYIAPLIFELRQGTMV